MGKYFFIDKPIVGLDISQTSLKIMAIDAKKWTVIGYGSLDVDPIKLQQSLDGDGQYLSEQIKLLIDKKLVGQLPSVHVAVSIPASHTYSRSLTLPGDLKGDLMDAVRLEAEQSIPVPVDQLYIDYEITSRSKDAISAYTCAAPRKITDNCVAACDKAGLKAVVVEPSMNAVARLLKVSEHGDLPTVIVDMGAASTDIAILDGTVKVTGGIPVGGNTLTLDIAGAMDISLEQAHQLKVLSGLTSSQHQRKLTKAVTPTLQKIMSEVQKIIRYYEERIPGAHPIEQVLMIGGGASMPGIGDYFTEHLEIASRVASPWIRFGFGELPQPSKQFKPRYISVAGLALLDPKEIWE